MKRNILTFLVTCLFLPVVHSQETELIASLKKHVYILASDSLLGRGFGYTSKRLAMNYITREFESAGLKPIKDTYVLTFIHQNAMVSVEGFNIAGLIEGSDPVLKSEYILIGAHFDHLGYKLEEGEKIIYNGADDNASGIASIIEIGRQLNATRELLKRSVIIVAFDAEEIGLVGSKNFLSEKIIEPENIRLMFSLDMVGMYGKNEGVEFNGIYSLLGGPEWLEKATEVNPIKIKKNKETIEMRTDTWSFAKLGIPAVHVHTGLVSPYHKPEDDSELLDYEGMAKIAECMVDFTRILSNKEELKPDQQGMKKSTDPFFKAGFNYKIGPGHFNYKDEFFRARSLFALEAGLVMQFKISKNIILQPELLYQTSASESAEGNTRRHSFSPQVDLLLTTSNKRKDKPFAYMLLGGYYNYHFAGTVAGKAMDFKSDYDQQEKGIHYGMGFQVQKFQIGYVCKLGMTNIYQDDEPGKVLNNCKYFSLVYFF